MSNERKEGTIKFYNAQKGFGFIEIVGEERDMFFGSSDLREGVSIEDGDTVTFEVGENRKGNKAIEIDVM